MPVQIRSLKGTDKDPRRRAGTRAGKTAVRDSAVNIGSRVVKAGRGIVLVDEAAIKLAPYIKRYMKDKVIAVVPLPNTSALVKQVLGLVGGTTSTATQDSMEVAVSVTDTPTAEVVAVEELVVDAVEEPLAEEVSVADTSEVQEEVLVEEPEPELEPTPEPVVEEVAVVEEKPVKNLQLPRRRERNKR